MAIDIRSAIYQLNYYGLSDFVIPFILIFAVVWAVLQKAKIFEERKVNIIIALAVALAAVIPHLTGLYPPQADVVDIINTAIPQVGGVLIAVLMLFIIVGMWGAKASWGESLHGVIVVLAIAAVVWIFGRAAGWFLRTPRWLLWLDNPANQALIVMILIFALIIAFITAKDEESGSGKISEGLKAFGDLFKKD